jgi:hypothetical protein
MGVSVCQDTIPGRGREVVIVVYPSIRSVLHPHLGRQPLVVCLWLVSSWIGIPHRWPEHCCPFDRWHGDIKVSEARAAAGRGSGEVHEEGV